MALYLIVSEGPSPLGARPILAVSDQKIIGNLLRSLGQLGSTPASDDGARSSPAIVRPIATRRRGADASKLRS